MFKKRIQKASARLELLNALKQLQADLNKLGTIPNNVEVKRVYNPYCGDECMLPIPKDFSLYDYAIKYFNIIAKFQDKGLLKPELCQDNETFQNLSKHINASGRCAYGCVRSGRGAEVTENNVYLGDVFGIWTFTIQKFKESARQSGSTRDFTQWAIQIYQLQSFLKSHVEPTKKLVNTMLKDEEKAKFGIVNSIFNKVAENKYQRR